MLYKRNYSRIMVIISLLKDVINTDIRNSKYNNIDNSDTLKFNVLFSSKVNSK